MLPISSELWSQAKASTFKPTYMIICRQHGNEYSSTNAGLRLIEKMTKDPVFREYLKRVNVTVVPFENVDGGEFSYQLQLLQPDFINHAGRYNSMGTDIGRYGFVFDTPYRAALVRTKMWQAWLPDVLNNDHGFPQHEYNLPYGSFTPQYYIPRGIIYGYLNYMATPSRDPIPEGLAVSMAIRDEIVAQLNTQPDIMANIQDWKDRYYKFANQWDPDLYPVTYYGPPGEDIVLYWSASRVNPFSNNFTRGYPWITTMMFTTEVADETAQGAYMDMAARAHFYEDLAQLNVLRDANPNIGFMASEVSGMLYLRIFRTRPVAP